MAKKIYHEFCLHLLQPTVLVLKRLQLPDMRGIHAAVLFAPVVKGGAANAVLPAKLHGLPAAFVLL